MLVTELNCVVC